VRWTSFADFCTNLLFPYFPTRFLTDFFIYNTQISTENIYRILKKQTGHLRLQLFRLCNTEQYETCPKNITNYSRWCKVLRSTCKSRYISAPYQLPSLPPPHSCIMQQALCPHPPDGQPSGWGGGVSDRPLIYWYTHIYTWGLVRLVSVHSQPLSNHQHPSTPDVFTTHAAEFNSRKNIFF
jgi:hypothetical protein